MYQIHLRSVAFSELALGKVTGGCLYLSLCERCGLREPRGGDVVLPLAFWLRGY